MSLRLGSSPVGIPDGSRMRATAHHQLGSTFFGGLPLEIRDMIYGECWAASGLRQHVFLRGGRLTHAPCVLAPGEADARLDELRRMLQARDAPRRPCARPLALGERWAARFSSPWHEHWRCEEEEAKAKATAGAEASPARRSLPSSPRRTLFLPILLACKRTYLEARPGLYAAVCLTFTDLGAAHACLALSPATTAAQLRSLAFSLALPLDALHRHRLRDAPGPWAELCTALSDLVRFAALREVTIRLGLAPASDEGGGGQQELELERAWWQVRERWALSAVRGMLARRLVVQLPRVEPTQRRPGWLQPYNYPDEGGGSGGGVAEVPFRRLERYNALPPMRLRRDGRVEPRMDAPRSPTSPGYRGGRLRRSVPAAAGRDGRTRLRKATRGVMELVAGLGSN
ncbi:hypothetical protein GGS23DRAFT_617635 [Durotheca rogersii]|uniref:uncharacterized protein n=1 Tax=Durotheca rogersii TaxID=419775 RepID=UPI00221FEA21|nr:uncharacterized protein GGS23DRAFT_617635 [Durotheca rogersii]KAI5856736.1 hypothetical protein GGS23DRAFT_617635 [Durotheca rogersii]